MNIYLYAAFAYVITSVISFLVVGIIVLVNKLTTGKGASND